MYEASIGTYSMEQRTRGGEGVGTKLEHHSSYIFIPVGSDMLAPSRIAWANP